MCEEDLDNRGLEIVPPLKTGIEEVKLSLKPVEGGYMIGNIVASSEEPSDSERFSKLVEAKIKQFCDNSDIPVEILKVEGTGFTRIDDKVYSIGIVAKRKKGLR